MLRRALVCGTLLTLSGPAWTAPAHAQDEARQHFDEGVRLFQRGEHAAALDEFRDAYRIRPHPSVLVNMANCYMEMGRPVEASEHFERYLREVGRDIDEERRAEVQRALGAARAALSTVDVQGSSGALVFVDGDAVGRTPFRRPVEVNPGPHTIELRHTDGSVQQERVRVDPGGEAVVQSRPSGAPATAPPPPGPGPGPDTGPAPDEPPVSGETPSGGGIPLGTWISGGAAVVTLAIGVGFAATAISQKNEFDTLVDDIRSRPPGDPAIADLQEEGRALADARSTNALIADVMFVATAVGAGLAIYFLLSQDDDEPSTTAAIAPTDGGAAVTLRSSF